MEAEQHDRSDEQHDLTLRERARARRRRFIERYEARRRERLAGKHHRFQRPIRLTMGLALVITGAAIGWLPGPWFIMLAIPGAFIVASEWRRAALLMDRVEEETIPRVYRAWARLRGGPKPEWIEEYPELWAAWIDRHDTDDRPDDDAVRDERPAS